MKPFSWRRKPRETKEQLASRLKGAAAFHAMRLLNGEEFEKVLERVRNAVPGFRDEQYRAAIEEGLATAKLQRQEDLGRRESFIAKARDHQLYDAVFMLRHFTNRPGGSRDRMSPIDVQEALGDMHSREAIEEAIAAADALLEAGWKCDLSETDAPTTLGLQYPGFSRERYWEAASSGYWASR